MSGTPMPRSPLGFDAFSASVALGVIAGALSVLWPPLDGLVAALASLAVVGAAMRYGSRSRAGRRRLTARGATVVGIAGLTAIVFLDPPAPLALWRGLLLGLSIVPWWAVERRRPDFVPPPAGSRA